MIIPVILSGGSGTRLWPLSREANPKPFIRLPDGESLLQKTLQRAAALNGVSTVLTVTNREHYFLTRDDYAETGIVIKHDYLLEPTGRNTAPAIAAAASHVFSLYGEDAVMLVLAADHLISDQQAFAEAVNAAVSLAEKDWLVTFGIKPTEPETGYGYIEAGDELDIGSAGRGYRVACFTEKPASALAREYLASGRHYWNSGMFCFKAARILADMQRYAPDVLAAAEASLAQADHAVQPLVLSAAAFASAPNISIDYAVMEKAASVAMVEARFGWDDIGSWPALAGLIPPDEQGNRFQGDVVAIDSWNNIVSSSGRVVATVGLDNMLIIDTPDALLVADGDRAQEVKDIVAKLRASGHEAATQHRTVHRPWGTYTVLEEGPGFKLKRIVVKPGASLSLQLHHRRSEHWVVVSGVAKVVNGEHEILISPNESTYIPANTQHRLMNPGDVDCVMIEVQVGDYVGEDDIVRLEDHYGRI